MHLDNLAPLLALWPLLLVFPVGLAGYLWLERSGRGRGARQHAELQRKYWVAEFAYRARMRASEWLRGTRTRRLTYQGPPLAPPEPPEEGD